MTIAVPELSLVVLIGASGAGKSSFARQHFLVTEVVSSDACRALVCDDENSLEATSDAFDLLHTIAGKRLKRGHLTVIDATNVQPESRAPLVALARQYHVQPVAIVLDVPERVCQDRNVARPDRQFGPHVVHNHIRQMKRGLRGLEREGFRHVHVLHGVEEIEALTIKRVPLWNNKEDEHGPFDLIGDVHGCGEELQELLSQLGYVPDETGVFAHPQGRKAVFVGDLIDRGPRVAQTLDIAMGMVEAGTALCVPGNHEARLERFWSRGKGQITHGLQETLDAIELRGPEYRAQVQKFIKGLISHYVLDDGKLVVAHAGLTEPLQGRASGAVRSFALYGDVTGEKDDIGLPIRGDWAQDYRGKASVVYGHTPVGRIEWLNNTINIDGGCVFGGRLCALRWPEREIVSVPAHATYAEPMRPFLVDASQSAQHQADDMLDYEDVSGKRVIETARGRVTVREDNARAALEVMSRFAADPRWLLYLPPTMSPPSTSREPGLLEYPAQAFDYYREEGATEVVCQEKHMGSRAVVIVCRDAEAAHTRFGIGAGDGFEASVGIVLTRTGRRFFNDADTEAALLERVRNAATRNGLWEQFETDWLCLDCELMPWSAKARELLRAQYAPVGRAARAELSAAQQALAAAQSRGVAVDELSSRYAEREGAAEGFVAAYRRYCWDVKSVDDYRLAPFHLLATEGRTHFDQSHVWHMETLHKLCADEPVLLATQWQHVNLHDEASCARGIAWWQDLTKGGGEGMVVKPLQFVVEGRNGRLLQPAVKCRGKEYLRLIYGPEYDAPENLERLRKRGLAAKRSLALREFELGMEGLERFVKREPLRRTHECAFGVLALESEPVDPRL